jgi:hypothetical protein
MALLASNKPNEPAPAAAPKFKRPEVGDMVHFFDETRSQPYGKPGVGPYAAIVTLHDIGGVHLDIRGPRGGNFQVENVRHKSELDPNNKSGKRWWQHRHETRDQGSGDQGSKKS